MPVVASQVVNGHVAPGFEAVRDAFERNFAHRHELGGACCVNHQGKKVVDLWGGIRNQATGEPWFSDTMADRLPFSNVMNQERSAHTRLIELPA